MKTAIRVNAGNIYHLKQEPPWWSAISHLVENKFCVLCYGGKDLLSCNWQKHNTDNLDIAIVQYSEAFEDVMDAIDKLELKNVTLITNNIGLQSTQNVSKHTYLWFEHMHTYHKKNFIKTRFNGYKERSKKFISLNGRRNVTRLFMIFSMKYMNLLQHGYVSLLPVSWKPTNINTWRTACLEVAKFSNDPNIIPDDTKFLDNLVVDRNMEGQDSVSNIMSNVWLKETNVCNVLDGPYHTTLQPMIDDTFFTVINETYTKSGEPFFFTEKTFKPIQYGHPFILCGVPGALQELRNLGYKTFHPYIDESYDLEVDDYKRYVKILEQINILCNMDDKTFRAFLRDTMDIVEHNYNTLRDKTHWIHNERTLD